MVSIFNVGGLKPLCQCTMPSKLRIKGMFALALKIKS